MSVAEKNADHQREADHKKDYEKDGWNEKAFPRTHAREARMLLFVRKYFLFWMCKKTQF